MLKNKKEDLCRLVKERISEEVMFKARPEGINQGKWGMHGELEEYSRQNGWHMWKLWEEQKAWPFLKRKEKKKKHSSEVQVYLVRERVVQEKSGEAGRSLIM